MRRAAPTTRIAARTNACFGVTRSNLFLEYMSLRALRFETICKSNATGHLPHGPGLYPIELILAKPYNWLALTLPGLGGGICLRFLYQGGILAGPTALVITRAGQDEAPSSGLEDARHIDFTSRK